MDKNYIQHLKDCLKIAKEYAEVELQRSMIEDNSIGVVTFKAICDYLTNGLQLISDYEKILNLESSPFFKRFLDTAADREVE